MATSLRILQSTMSSSDSMTQKPTHRIKQHVDSYHTTEVIAHQTPKPVIANCVPKLVAMATRPSAPMDCHPHMIPTAHLRPQPKWHPYRFSRLCTDDRRVSLYFTMGHPFPTICPFPWGDLEPHLIHGSLGPPQYSTQMAARSVQPFLEGSLV